MNNPPFDHYLAGTSHPSPRRAESMQFPLTLTDLEPLPLGTDSEMVAKHFRLHILMIAASSNNQTGLTALECAKRVTHAYFDRFGEVPGLADTVASLEHLLSANEK